MTTTGNGNNLLIQGRILWTTGKNLFEGQQKKDFNTGQPITNADGSPVIEYGFGLAIPKMNQNGQTHEQFQTVWDALHQEAFTLYPSGQIPPDFAMKYKDGDGIDHNGKPFADREGYAGHIVLTCTTQIPIKFFRFEGGNNILVNDGIKCGDYVNVQLNIKAHPAKGRGKPGLYLNPSAVQLIQPGKEIINSPSGDQIFGQNVPSYAGQVEADTAPQMPSQAQVNQAEAIGVPPGAPTTTQMPGQTPAAPQAPAPQPQQAPQPHYDVIPQQHQPAPQAPAPQPQQAPQAPAPQPQTQVPNQGTPAMPAMPGMPR